MARSWSRCAAGAAALALSAGGESLWESARAVDDESGADDAGEYGLSMLQRRTRQALGATREPERRFLVWLSDMHMDPYYGVRDQYQNNSAAVCSRFVSLSEEEAKSHPFGVRPCDPPLELWRSALRAAHEMSQGAELALFTGDFVRHKQQEMPDPWTNTTTALRGVGDAFAETFGDLGAERLVLGMLGNDDSPGNYHLDIVPENPWLANVASILHDGGAITSQRAEEFARGGFFEARLGDADSVRILSLNTLIYSALHKPAEPKPEDPFGQFAWLRERLEDAVQKNESVWIVGHIPPGIESFGYTALWRKQYVTPYLDIVQDPVLGSAIRVQLFGHVHADEFRVLPNAPPGAGPILLTGSVSPIFESNPSFRVLEYDRATGKVLNVKIFWADIDNVGAEGPEWKFGYDFLGTYPVLAQAVQKEGGLTNQAFMDLRHSMRKSSISGGNDWDMYAKWYKTQCTNDLTCVSKDSDSGLSLETRLRFTEMYLCALTVGRHADFADCAKDWALRDLVEGDPFDDSELYPGVEAFTDARTQHWKSIAKSGEQGAVSERCGHVLRSVQKR